MVAGSLLITSKGDLTRSVNPPVFALADRQVLNGAQFSAVQFAQPATSTQIFRMVQT